MKSSLVQISELLVAWQGGDKDALDSLIVALHAELRQLARRFMRRERAGHTLQTSALVNEAYLRLAGARPGQLENRIQFIGVAAHLMRQILVDHARANQRLKRGGGAVRVDLDQLALMVGHPAEELLALDEALCGLAAINERKAKVVELRFFGGLDVQETAQALGVSENTVIRDWAFAKAWLTRHLTGRGNVERAVVQS